MKIRSRFKDYYDYVEHVYGGGDPKIPYNRDFIQDPTFVLPANEALPEGDTYLVLPSTFKADTLNISNGNVRDRWLKVGEVYEGYRGLSVAGKMYFLRQDYIGYQGDSNPTVVTKVTKPWYVVESMKFSTRWPPQEWTEYSGTLKEELIKIHQYLKAPVFVFDTYSDGKIAVWQRVPALGALGLPALVPAEQVYQELAMFMGKMYTENPDMQPQHPRTDIEKVEAHGFDKKQSFRHRK